MFYKRVNWLLTLEEEHGLWNMARSRGIYLDPRKEEEKT
jgi:hypothetical protein